MILVDTPIWSLALRRRAAELAPSERGIAQVLAQSERGIAQVLAQVVQEGRAKLLGPVRQELLSGLREEPQLRKLRDLLRDFPDVSVATEDYEHAAHASNRCRGAGIATSPVDMLICAVALREQWEIFTTDKDFERYKTILKIRLLSI